MERYHNLHERLTVAHYGTKNKLRKKNYTGGILNNAHGSECVWMPDKAHYKRFCN